MITRFKDHIRHRIGQRALSTHTENVLGGVVELFITIGEPLAKALFFLIVVPIVALLAAVFFGPPFLLEKLYDAIKNHIVETRLNNALKNKVYQTEIIEDFLKPEVEDREINYKNFFGGEFERDDYAGSITDSVGGTRSYALRSLVATANNTRFLSVWLDVMDERIKIDPATIIPLKQKMQRIKEASRRYTKNRIQILVPEFLTPQERKQVLFFDQLDVYYARFSDVRAGYLNNKYQWQIAITILTSFLVIPLFLTIPALLNLNKQKTQEDKLIRSTFKIINKMRTHKLNYNSVLWQIGKLYLNQDDNLAYKCFSKISPQNVLFSAAVQQCAKLLSMNDQLDIANKPDAFLWYIGNEFLNKNPNLAFKCFSRMSEEHKFYSEAMLHCSFFLRINNQQEAADDYLKRSKDKKILFVQNAINKNPDLSLQDVYQELRKHAPTFGDEKKELPDSNSSVKALDEEEPEFKLEAPLPANSISIGPNFS